ncbi:unnamed protein product [Staurois parvus]|uniref:Uncharacterized protein n=1 Tax=Staurois parvus TaxID=386267 RepID=A0ABN9CAV1_9NEOB|nr:unnamed protein product [Staurois parvus]
MRVSKRSQTGQGSGQEKSAEVRIKAGLATNQIGRYAGTQDTRYRGSWETTPRH